MAASSNARVQRLIKSAEELARKGERQKALTEFHKILDIDPENKQVLKRVSELDREVSAMRNFKKTRDSRTHKTGTSVSSNDFVTECISRSEEAFKQGDEVRALQELERAKRHDPDNKMVRRRILTVRRQIKTDNLYDMALAKLQDGDLKSAVRNTRNIFKTWPSAPVLPDLLKKLEAYKPAVAAAAVADSDLDDFEDIELDEDLEVVAVPEEKPVKEAKTEKAKTEKAKTSAAEAAIAVIRAKISRSDYAGALAEAKKARKKHPGNATIGELLVRLESLTGNKKEPKAAAPAAVPPAVEKREKKEKKSPIGLIIAAVAVIVILVVIFVVKPFGTSGPAEDTTVVADVFEPYTLSYSVSGPESYSITVDGETVTPLPDGSFVLEGDSEAPRTIEVRAAGFETYQSEITPLSGDDTAQEIALDTLGTNTVEISFAPSMPEGEAAPGQGEVVWLVDGEASEGSVTLSTGMHVFQAELEGFNSVPESILVDYTSAPTQISLTLLSQTESQVILALGGDIPGTGNFTIDGARVGTGVRRISEVLPFGTHTLSVDVENHEPWTRTITLDQGGYSATVVPTEIVTTGRLLIAPEPWANVTVDGVSAGQTPMAPVDLEEGQHTVLLTNPDYQDQTITVDITAGEDTSIRYTAEEAIPEGPEIIEEEQPVIPPFPISQIAPSTPGLAQDMGDVHGYVTLDVVVGTDGSVQNVSIVSDELGLGCGAAAEAAVRQWVFNPATQGGEPVEITTRVQVRFDVE